MSAQALQQEWNTNPLTALDRCDRCGAQAYVRATLTAGGELLFCNHHWREHEDKVIAVSAHIHQGPGPA